MMSESHQPYVVHSEFHNDTTSNTTAPAASQGRHPKTGPPTPANWSTPTGLDVIVLRSQNGDALTIRVVNPQPHPIRYEPIIADRIYEPHEIS